MKERKKRLLLIQSTPYDGVGADARPIKKKRLYFVGLGLPLLAALTPDDWEVEIVLETIEDIPFDTPYDLVGIGSMGHAVVRSLDIASTFRARGVPVVLGGYMVSLMPDEALKYADAVVVGDAEDTWMRVLSDHETGQMGGIYRTDARRKGTYHTPPPRFDLIVDKAIGDFLPVQAARGCPRSCSFCSVACLYRGRYLKRTLEEVIRDVEQVKALGFSKFLLLDDNIAADRSYLLALCERLKPLKMQWLSQCDVTIGRDEELLGALFDSGCIALSFGLESLNEKSLAGMNKGWADASAYPELLANIRRAGIDLSSEMVVGGEGDTVEGIMATADFIREQRIVVPRFYILTPIPGTPYFDEMKAAGRLVHEEVMRYNGSEAVHRPARMSAEDLTRAYWALYEKVFRVDQILQRTLFRRQALRQPGRALFYLGVNLYYRYQIKRRIPPNII